MVERKHPMAGTSAYVLTGQGVGVKPTYQAAARGGGAKMHIALFSTQAPTTTKINPPATVSAANIGTTSLGFGAAVYVRMDGFTTIRLMVWGANSGTQTGTVTVDVYNATNDSSLVSVTWNDTTLQIRENTATIALTGVKRVYARAKSTVAGDDPLIGDICCQLE